MAETDRAARFLELRKQHRLTQMEVAKKLKVTQQTVGSWENGIAIPRSDVLARLAKLYGTTSDDLLGLDSGKFAKLEKRVKRLERLIEEIKETNRPD